MAEADSVPAAGGSEMDVKLRRRRFTVEEYQRMAEAGILDEDERVELIAGEIVEMTPIGPVHGSVVARTVSLLVSRLRDRAIVWPQNSIVLRTQASQLQPDIALLRPRTDYYRSANPEPRDILLAIEVMDSSMDRDRRVKLPIYARAGLGEVWLVDVTAETVEVCRQPTAADYGDRRLAHRIDTIGAEAFPDLALPVAAILG